MDNLLGLLVLAVAAIPVLLIIFMVWTLRLAKEVRRLQSALDTVAARLDLSDQTGEGPTPAPAALKAAQEPPQKVAEAKPSTDAASPWEAKAPEQAPEQASAKGAAKGAAAALTTPAPGPAAAVDGPPKAVVLKAETLEKLTRWLRANWIYAVSAVSLAFAGLFLLQYGIETGLLTPAARVAVALAFGAGLVVVGEYIRRRWGDREDATTAYLPSVFSGAGIVTLFGAVLAALHLYGLIGAGTGFAGLAAVAALAIGLGWYSGPLLAALGVAGAYGAPFLVGGESPHPELFYGYFALVFVVGLAIDAGRRWAWVSVLALAGFYPAVTLLWLGSGWPELQALVLVGAVLATMTLPTLSLTPRHGGAAVLAGLFAGYQDGYPAFPTRLVAASMLASVAGIGAVGWSGGADFWLALAALTVLFFAVAGWAVRAEALEELAIVPALALLGLPVAIAVLGLEPYAAFRAVLTSEEGTPVPFTPVLLVGLGVGVGLGAAWRSRRGGRWPVIWGAAAVLLASLPVFLLEFFWQPGDVLGAYPWALAVIGVAAVMVVLALTFVRKDGESRPRVAGFALAAFALIALALALIFTKTALTLAFAVLTLAAAGLDRRFTLRPMSVAMQVGAVGLAYRLLIDPGLDWALGDAPWWEMILAYAGPIAALFGALWFYRALDRPRAKAVAESAGWTLLAAFAALVLARGVDEATPGAGTESHWFAGLVAVIWFAAAANQLWRVRLGGALALVRRVLAGLYAAVGLLALLLGLTVFNPAVWYSTNTAVQGWPVLNSLILGYLLPGAVVAAIGWRFAFLPLWLRRAAMGVGAALAALWLALTIRHGWRGAEMDSPGFTQPELYTYTMALLLIGAGLLYQAIAHRSAGMRMAAMAVIGLSVAKVFLVDISGLVGLLRVFSFLALGLTLAGLAFLNRWAAGQIADGEEEASGPPD